MSIILINLVAIKIYSQDLIITNAGDSINCIIKNSIKDEICYYVIENNKYVEKTIKNDMIQEVKFNFFKGNDVNNKASKGKNNTKWYTKNIFAFGYQIGGLSLIGVDYEFRLHDYWGIHAGAGFWGYTGGINVHFKPHKNSSFINFSYKNRFYINYTYSDIYNNYHLFYKNLISTFAMEYGGRLLFNKKNTLRFAFHYQIGIARITNIEYNLKVKLYDENPLPEVSLMLGIGVSW